MRSVFSIVLLAGTALMPVAANAQSNVEGRVGKLESEMRAVQRKVFPGGAGQTLQPEIVAPDRPRGDLAGTPASSPLADVTARVTSLEQQMATLTGQSEQNGYKLRLLQEQFDTYRRATDARLATLAAGASPDAGPAGLSSPDSPMPRDMPTPRSASPRATRDAPARDDAAPSAIDRPARATGAASRPTPVSTTPARAKLVDAVERPSSGDTPEDEYLYGYRLWQAKLYPEAEAQLKKVVTDYPKNRRASYAQNLLGRSYLDDGKPSLASMAFYENYKKMPDGERAPESLLYLGKALMTLKKPADACKVYGELDDVYGAKLSAAMKADMVKGRAAAKCG
ncbi:MULTISPECIES: hypothetical protein [unclassified Sphingomonas]|uniref:tetratricopeptide repeat protein n=1 Tax=unclassified Sphingomonas TaxID=196159 RepID=UPI00226A1076|nr:MULTISPECIES: hypothetical protein [unclassified Sphingomonas]